MGDLGLRMAAPIYSVPASIFCHFSLADNQLEEMYPGQNRLLVAERK
jgi:hypothetical protein